MTQPQAPQQFDLSFLHLKDGRRLIPSVQSLVLDCLDNDALAALNATSRTAQLFLQEYLSRIKFLSLCQRNDKHELWSLAVRHCSKLAHVSYCLHRSVGSVADLITHNASSLTGLTGPVIKDVAILTALQACLQLKSLDVLTNSRETLELVTCIASKCQQLKSLRFGEDQKQSIGSVLFQASPGLLELATPVFDPDDLLVVASRFSQLQTLHVTVERVEAFLPSLRHLASSLTDLSVTSGPESLEGLEGDIDVIRAFLRSRGYQYDSWDEDDLDDEEPKPEREIQVLEMPRLRKLKLDQGVTNTFVVQSEVLEEAAISVFFEPGLALEILRPSPALRKFGLFVHPEAEVPGEHEERVFVEACRLWSHLTDLESEMGLTSPMFSALVAHCPRLKNVNVQLLSCTVDSALALFALPCIESVNLQTFDLFLRVPHPLEPHSIDEAKVSSIEQVDEQEEGSDDEDVFDENEECDDDEDVFDEIDFKLPAIVQSNVRSLHIAGKWYNVLVDRLRCPRLHTLHRVVSASCPELRVDSLVNSASHSLVQLCLYNKGSRVSKPTPLANIDWSRFQRLALVQVPWGMAMDDVVSLVSSAPQLRNLRLFLDSPQELTRLLSISHSTLQCMTIDAKKEKPWSEGCLDALLPSLLNPESRPRDLELLKVPSGSVLSQIPRAEDGEMYLGGVVIDVKAYRTAGA